MTINLRGRQPLGIVEPGKEYEDLRNYIIEKLYGLSDPDTSERVIERILKREEIYHGPYAKNGPDLYVKPKQGYAVSTRGFRGPLFGKPAVSGTHLPYGVFIAYGPDIQKGHKIKYAQIIDIDPTILHMMGTPIPRAMDGKVLKNIFEKDG